MTRVVVPAREYSPSMVSVYDHSPSMVPVADHSPGPVQVRGNFYLEQARLLGLQMR